MTIKKIIEAVDLTKPNDFEAELKVRWIAELDGKIAADVFLMGYSEIAQFQYVHPESLDKEPLVTFPHDDIYRLWLMAQIDLANGEYNKYQNTMAAYNEIYGNFVRWFARVWQPAQGDSSCFVIRENTPQYYITAYGLAVRAGFTGTLEDWLASLKGDVGDITPELERLRLDVIAEKQAAEEAAERATEAVTVAAEEAAERAAEVAVATVAEAADRAAEAAYRAEEAARTFEIDETLSISGRAADAKAVGNALAQKQPKGTYLDTTDKTLLLSGKAADAAAVGEALQQKAPAGYVDLTDTLISEDDIMDYIKSAVENMNDFTEKRMTFMDYDGNAVFVSVKKAETGYSALITEEVVPYMNPHYTRKMVAVYDPLNDDWVFGEWEYENPPMFPGVEYRLTERHNGNPVYTQLVDCGPMLNKSTSYTPVYYNANSDEKNHKIVKNDIVYMYPFAVNTDDPKNGDFHNFPDIAGGTNVCADVHWNWVYCISARTQSDCTNYKLMVVIKYTKLHTDIVLPKEPT